ncbi:MAG: pyridoxamine 5'-phosphate oxidase [Flavobacteriaceae bacterium]|nr:pyridoxamine 5'-phosphate oxidase [Flavobacteriaceae bacterium]
MKKDISQMRTQYQSPPLLKKHISENPIVEFSKWFERICADKKIKEPNAMILSTIGLDGYPRNRIVLLKFYGPQGFGFYTNYQSDKAQSILKNPHVGLGFYWPHRHQQVLIKGKAKKIDDATSQQYFESRPKGSQMAALLSHQSSIIPSRSFLEKGFEQLKKQFTHQSISKPTSWGGYQVNPVEYEFWQGQKNRLHDRLRYSNKSGNWKIERLAP